MMMDPIPDSKRHVESNSASETGSMTSLLLQGQSMEPMQLVARVPTDLFYWPSIQLAASATHNIVLGVSVGSKGGGNLQISDTPFSYC
ncbi:hypothetical protein Tco_0377728 [Tanacetum coccineum]